MSRYAQNQSENNVRSYADAKRQRVSRTAHGKLTSRRLPLAVEPLELRRLLAYSISPSPVSVNEGAGSLTFTITRSGSFPAETIFASTVQGSANGYAANNGDYAGLLNQAVTFAANQAQKTIAVSITNDSATESNETFGFIVQRNSSDPVSTFLAKANFTIVDNDLSTSYSISPSSASVNENAGSLIFTVTRAGGLPAETVFASTLQGASNGYATNNNDYSGLLNQGVLFSANQTQQTIAVSITNDSATESDETFGFIVQRNSSDPVSMFLAKANFNIVDNDQPTIYSFSPSSASVNENAGSLMFTITRSGGLPTETVFASTVQGASNGYASNNSDYNGLVNQGVTFSANQTQQVVTIAILDDTVSEADETFGLIVQRRASDPISTNLAKTNYTIVDNDMSPPTYALTPTTVSISEGAGTLTFTVTRSGPLPAETIFASTVQGAANAYATNANDYIGLNNQAVTFTANQVQRTVSVVIMSDNEAEGAETFGMIIQRNSSDPILTHLANATFTIVDDDQVTSNGLLFDRAIYFAQHEARFGTPSASQQTGLNTLLAFIENDSALARDADFQHLRWAAYLLATARHETAITYQPVTEYWDLNYHELRSDRPGHTATSQQDYFNYWYSGVNGNGSYASGDGSRYRGRGYVQLTGRGNYAAIGTALGVDLVNNPDLALNAQVAYQVISFGMRAGRFTGKKLSDYITASTTDYVNARRIINGTDAADAIADAATKFEAALRASLVATSTPGITYTLAPMPATVSESDGSLTFTVTRSGSLPAETVYISTTQTEGTLNNADYAPLLNQPLAFAVNQGAMTVVVSITNDGTAELNENFGLIAQRNASDPVTTYLAKTTFMIIDEDIAPPQLPPRVLASSLNYDAVDGPQLRVQFSGDVAASVGVEDLDVIRTSDGSRLTPSAINYDATSNAALFDFASWNDGLYSATLVAAGISDGISTLDGNGDGTAGDNFVSAFSLLAGDADHDGTVNFSDLVILAQNYGSSGRTFSQGNFNYDITVDFADLVILAQRYGTTFQSPQKLSTAPNMARRLRDSIVDDDVSSAL
jgi:predicted chitinase